MIILSVIVALIVLYAIFTYNSFIKLNNSVKEAFATMDVYLKKRWDLIPNLVETVKGYAEHEKETFQKITNLRSSSYSSMTTEEKIEANKQLTMGLSKLIAVAENYPELKSNTNFLDLSGQLQKIEEDIANARKYYNAIVKEFNTKIQLFPSNIIANMFHFTEAKMFEVDDDSQRENVQVKF